MKKHFYNHLVEIDSLIIELDNLNLEKSEKEHLLSIVDSGIYHAILDAILSELSEEDKKVFLDHLACDDHEKVWKHLNGKIENIEEKIKKTAEDLKSQLHEDIKKTKKT